MFDWQPYWQSETLRVFLVVCAVLVVASSVAALLRWRIAKSAPHAVIDNLVARINAWWWMVGLLGAAFLFERDGVIVLFALISFLALREFITLTQTRRGDHAALAVSFFIALPAQFFLIWIEWYGLWSILIPVYAFLLLPILAALSADTTRFLERAAKVQWGLMICVFCLSHVPALVTLEIADYSPRNLLLIAFLIIVVQGSDVLQYIFGKLFGKHLLAPALSPSKTWEGLVGGILSATALGGALYQLTPFTVMQAASIAFVVCLMGFLGGLVMSAIKRDRGVKDWGHLIEGHGGVLDRIDSLVFAAPIYFHVIRFWWT